MFRPLLPARRRLPKALDRFRPVLTELENRIVPSSRPSGGALQGPAHWALDSLSIQILTTPNPVAVQPVQWGGGPVSPADLTPYTPSGTIDFFSLPINKAYTLEVYFSAGKAPNVKTFDTTYNIAAGTTREAVRDLVLGSLTGIGWNASASGTTALTVTGYTDPQTGARLNLTGVGAGSKDLPASTQPAVSGTTGVQRGTISQGNEKWKFTFRTPQGGSGVTDDATVVASANSTTVSVAVHSGETGPQVAQDLYNAMVSAGFADATFDGTNITSFNDPTGAETTDASLYFTATGGPVIGDTEELAPVIVVPQRYME